MAVAAWVAATNAAGGLSCHPVKLVTGDDAGDPSRNQSLVQQFVEQDHVIAFVYMDAPFAGRASVSYLESHQIPAIGSEGGSEWFNQSPMFFPQMSSGHVYVEGAFAAASAAGLPQAKTKIATVTCIEAPICSSAYDAAPGLASKYRMNLVYRARVSVAQPDFTAVCQAAKGAGAAILWTGVDGNSDQRLARSCQSIGFHPLIVTPAVGITPAQASAPELAGLVVGLPTLPWFETSNPEVATFHQVLTQYAPALQPGGSAFEGWVAAKLFQLAAQHLANLPSSQNILDGLWSISSNDLGGVTVPLTFHKGASSQQQPLCWWMAEFQGQRAFSPNAAVRTCQQ